MKACDINKPEVEWIMYVVDLYLQWSAREVHEGKKCTYYFYIIICIFYRSDILSNVHTNIYNYVWNIKFVFQVDRRKYNYKKNGAAIKNTEVAIAILPKTWLAFWSFFSFYGKCTIVRELLTLILICFVYCA